MQQATGVIFPGQGSQKEGMLGELGTRFPVIRQTFEEASDVLNYDLWALTQNDPDQKLNQTSITQPAILTASVALWRLWLEQGGPMPDIMAGHSLGEYSALVSAGALAFKDAVGLVQKRGEYMQSAVPMGEGGMAAIVGLDDDAVIQACRAASDDEVVDAVNFNSPGQVVIAGHKTAVERAIAICKEKGAKRALPLPVSAPFHSSLMEPAAERFAEQMARVALMTPSIPVLQNYGLQVTTDDVDAIRGNLIKQIHSPVPWVDTIRRFAQRGITRVLEIGPGKVLCGLNKRIESGMEALPVNDEESLATALEAAGVNQ